MAVSVECGIPNYAFGDFISLLEFINTFSDLLELSDVYPYGISFEMLENGVVAKEVAGGLRFIFSLYIYNNLFICV